MTSGARDAEEQKAILEGYDWLQNPVWHFQFHQIEPDRLILFAPHLPKGVYTIEFTVEGALSGRFTHLPAQIYSLFEPDLKGKTESNIMVIKE